MRMDDLNNPNKSDKLGKQGLTIVETLIAFAFLAVVSIAMISISISALSVTTSARLQTVASRYAESAIEGVRSYRDNVDWSFFYALTTNGCYKSAALDDPCGVAVWPDDYGISGDVNFRRRILLTGFNSNTVRVGVEIQYLDRGKSELVSIDSCFTNWGVGGTEILCGPTPIP